jgi:hypothetical protein
MNLSIFLVAVTGLLLNTTNGTDDLIQWNPSRKLTWNDFQAMPDGNSTNAALTSSSIYMKFSSDGTSLQYEITCNFDKKKSWGRVKNDHILAHEQGHFDITEIHARRLSKALAAYRANARTLNKDVNDIYKAEMENLQRMQSQYDSETSHSRNFKEQQEWENKIENMLKSSERYAGYGKMQQKDL